MLVRTLLSIFCTLSVRFGELRAKIWSSTALSAVVADETALQFSEGMLIGTGGEEDQRILVNILRTIE